ncbi:MAG: hypothetical protein IBJ09_04325 [Bacteroidia bacterium]|nr:hypothetical protein [Bacteroidia bacterium]
MKDRSLYLGGLLGFLACSLLFMFTGCPDPAGTPPSFTPIGKVFVPESLAKRDIARFAQLCNTEYDSFPLRGFTMNSSDLYRIMDSLVIPESNQVQVRGYIALDTTNTYKLYLVGARAVGTGVDPVGSKDTLIHYENTLGVLDLNAPCPNTCDLKSPLLRAGLPIEGLSIEK